MSKIQIKVAVGRQVFSPLAYHTLEVPEFSVAVEGDTLTEAHELAMAGYAWLRDRQDEEFIHARARFFSRAIQVKEMMGTEVPSRR
jgi:hypothetical protein